MSAWGQPFRMCDEVGLRESQRGQVLETLYWFQCRRFSGVGRQSEPALSRKDSWPAGNPANRRFQVWDRGSSMRLGLISSNLTNPQFGCRGCVSFKMIPCSKGQGVWHAFYNHTRQIFHNILHFQEIFNSRLPFCDALQHLLSIVSLHM